MENVEDIGENDSRVFVPYFGFYMPLLLHLQHHRDFCCQQIKFCHVYVQLHHDID